MKKMTLNPDNDVERTFSQVVVAFSHITWSSSVYGVCSAITDSFFPPSTLRNPHPHWLKNWGSSSYLALETEGGEKNLTTRSILNLFWSFWSYDPYDQKLIFWFRNVQCIQGALLFSCTNFPSITIVSSYLPEGFTTTVDWELMICFAHGRI